jgi:hypothetical protein
MLIFAKDLKTNDYYVKMIPESLFYKYKGQNANPDEMWISTYKKKMLKMNGTVNTSEKFIDSAVSVIVHSSDFNKYMPLKGANMSEFVYCSMNRSVHIYFAPLINKNKYNDVTLAQFEKYYYEKVGISAFENGLAVPLILNKAETGDAVKDAKQEEENSRILRIRFDSDKMSLNFKAQFEGKTFDKTYKITKKNTLNVIFLRAYMNLCTTLKVHPAKAYFGSSAVWNSALLPAAQCTSQQLLIYKCVGVKVQDFHVYVKLAIFSRDNLKTPVGERVMRIDLNYEHFDIKNESNANTAKAIDDANFSDDELEELLSVMSIKFVLSKTQASSDEAAYTDFKNVPTELGKALNIFTEELMKAKKYSNAAAKGQPAQTAAQPASQPTPQPVR